jgi:DeoR/GlpR family transcriptional regulator of sugar metabolism
MAEKTAIAKEAATLVSDNQSMLICHGSTCSMLVNYLDSDYKLKIVTNSTLILDLARSNRNLEVTILGGKFYPLLDATLGSHVVDQVDDYYVDTFFMGADGLSADFGVSTILEENVALFKHMASHAGKKVLLADSSKLNKKGIYRILSLDELDCLIIDSGCPSDFVHQVREKGIEVRLVEAMRGGA